MVVATAEFLELHCHARTRQILGGGLPGQLDGRLWEMSLPRPERRRGL